MKAGDKIIYGDITETEAITEGWFFKPMIIEDIQPNSPAITEEFFGPVFTLFRAKDQNEAISLANSSEYGLGASLWTQNEERA